MAKGETYEKQPEHVALSVEQFQELIAAVKPKAVDPKAPSIEEAFEAHQRMLQEARQRAHVGWFQAFVSRDTGARGVAYITESRRHANGRVINLPHYVYPEGSDRTRANGGICDMTQIHDAHGQPTPEFKQWRYQFWKNDLRAYVGQDAKRLDSVGPARPTLDDALADLYELAQRPPAEEMSRLPEIVARGASSP